MSDWHKHLRRLEVASAADMPEWQTKWRTEWQIQWQTEWQRQTEWQTGKPQNELMRPKHMMQLAYVAIKTALFPPFAYEQYEWDSVILMRLQVLRDGNKIRNIWGVRTQGVWDCKRAQDDWYFNCFISSSGSSRGGVLEIRSLPSGTFHQCTWYPYSVYSLAYAHFWMSSKLHPFFLQIPRGYEPGCLKALALQANLPSTAPLAKQILCFRPGYEKTSFTLFPTSLSCLSDYPFLVIIYWVQHAELASLLL